MNRRSWTLLTAAIIIGAMPTTWISSAYAGQLFAVGVPSNAGGFVPKVPIVGNPEVVRDSFAPTDSLPKKGMKMMQNSQTYLNRWFDTVKKKQPDLLWSSYPASIRGQVFSNTPAGNNPMEGGGW
ncbi:MAG TPA: hypothetical protein V6C76_06785 [Drouetiella sp.]